MFKKIVALFTLSGFLLLTGAACGGGAAAVPAEKTKKVTLQYWGVYTDSDNMDTLLAAFRKRHPNISIEYRKFRPEEYEKALVDAFSEDKGPDLFTIHSSWVQRYKTKLAPMPANISYAVFTTTGGMVGQKTTITLANTPAPSLKQVREKFVGVVEQDGMMNETNTSTVPSIYALPFYLDTLAMFYNKDLLEQNNIVSPATDWGTIQNQSVKMTRVDAAGAITQSGVAMGTGAGVHRVSDLLASLIMQNGARMTRSDGAFTFQLGPNGESSVDGQMPGAVALQFYTDFANPEKKVYTWNFDQGDALAAFATGKVGYYFGYGYDAATISSRNPRLSFDVALLPQLNPSKQVNIANYWMEAVAKKSQFKDEAWLFILETATGVDKDALNKYLKDTKRISALKEVLQTQFEDPDVGTFAKQALTARSWYHGKDNVAADQIFTEMADDTLTKLKNRKPEDSEAEIYQKELNRGAARLNDTL